MATVRITAGWLVLSALALPASALAQADAAPETSTAAPTPPPGATVDEDARLHFELGRRAFARADYEVAAAEFEEAWRLSQRAELHYNLFLVYHELDREQDAVRELQLYLPSASDEETRSHLEQRLARIERALEAREAPPPEESGPPPDTIDIGESVVVPETADETPAPPPSQGTELVAAGIAGLSLGAIALVVMAGTGATALDQRHALDAQCAPSCSEEQVASTRALALASDVSLGAGLALAAAGAVLLGVGLGQAGSSETPMVVPAVTTTSVALVVAGTL